MTAETPMRTVSKAAAACAAAALAALVHLLGCSPPSQRHEIVFCCGEGDLTNHWAFRETVSLAPGASSRAFAFTAFAGATTTAEVRILDGSSAYSLGVRAVDATGAAVVDGAIDAPARSLAFTPAASGLARLTFTNAGAAPLRFQVRGLAARGGFEDHAFTLNLHFAGPFGGLTPEAASATAQDLLEGVRPFYEPLGIAIPSIRVFQHTADALRAAGVPTTAQGDAAITTFEIPAHATSCGTRGGVHRAPSSSGREGRSSSS